MLQKTEEGREHLAHHFDDVEQQFSAAKLGMWIFLGTEVLLFGGLFCAYAVLRRTYPEIFAYGHHFLDTRLGILNTVILITSSVTMATGVTAAQLGRNRLLIAMLALTFLGAAGFMTVKYIEYHHKFHERLVWGTAFYDAPEWARRAERERLAHMQTASAGPAAATVVHEPDAANGADIWTATCRTCHGASGEGVSGQGKDVRGAEFITSRSDTQLVEFLKVGRAATAAGNTTGVAMPPRGGNPLLSDNDLLDVIAHVRTFKAGERTAAADVFVLNRSSLPPAPPGPAGLMHVAAIPVGEAEVFPHHALDPARPAKAHLFFGLYFLMTGLHGFHVLVGMVLIGWLLFRAIRREFGPTYFTPVDLGGLYWHVVDLIWIFLFPLLYLIS